MWLLLL